MPLQRTLATHTLAAPCCTPQGPLATPTPPAWQPKRASARPAARGVSYAESGGSGSDGSSGSGGEGGDTEGRGSGGRGSRAPGGSGGRRAREPTAAFDDPETLDDEVERVLGHKWVRPSALCAWGAC